MFKGSSQRAKMTPRELLDRLYLRVLGFTYQVLGDAELAAQATESVFVRRDPPMDDLAVWTAAIATVRGYVARGFVVRPLAPQSHSWQAALLRQLAELPPMERALLLLRYHEGLETTELAQILGIPERDVRKQVATARGRLLDLSQK
ncbi:MAG TPA: sigma factor-like helix-turn-helix DNA-binding protein [Herpetosiphonaceae bacterium]